MNNKHESHGERIDPIFARLGLTRRNEAPVDTRLQRAQIEECRLPERIGKIAADLNRAAGYHLLEMVDFLPPQSTILRISFSKGETDYDMEIVLREDSAAVVFSYRKGISRGWARYFSISAQRRNRITFLDLDFHAAEILEEDIEDWFCYLLSGFERRLRPSRRLQVTGNSGVSGGIIFDKASA